MESEGHIPILRKCYDKKPTLMIVTGNSMIGKTTLSFLLKSVPKSFYVSLDQMTLDENLPIKNINDLVIELGYKRSSGSIFRFQDEVFKNKKIFIDHCFKFILNQPAQFFIFDGVYFTNNDFLDEFIKKFGDKYYIWVTTRQINNNI
jgi:predicted AAA+ superfamily ATPase